MFINALFNRAVSKLATHQTAVTQRRRETTRMPMRRRKRIGENVANNDFN
jgi:hypothetical protein